MICFGPYLPYEPLPPCVPRYPHGNLSRGVLRKHAADLKKAERKHREGKCACRRKK